VRLPKRSDGLGFYWIKTVTAQAGNRETKLGKKEFSPALNHQLIITAVEISQLRLT
jgi:hypothetical protein